MSKMASSGLPLFQMTENFTAMPAMRCTAPTPSDRMRKFIGFWIGSNHSASVFGTSVIAVMCCMYASGKSPKYEPISTPQIIEEMPQ